MWKTYLNISHPCLLFGFHFYQHHQQYAAKLASSKLNLGRNVNTHCLKKKNLKHVSNDYQTFPIKENIDYDLPICGISKISGWEKLFLFSFITESWIGSMNELFCYHYHITTGITYNESFHIMSCSWVEFRIFYLIIKETYVTRSNVH